MKLQEIKSKNQGIEDSFKHKKVLFIGSRSYDAPAITILQGLDELGFEIFTIKQGNINAWFCNKVIDNPTDHEFDFVLSNVHWGTRWSYYQKYDLGAYPWVLIDGDDDLSIGNWEDKLNYHQQQYTFDPPEKIKNKRLNKERWVEPYGNYETDVVFVSQNNESQNGHYLPFGIHKQYLQYAENKSTKDRSIDIAHITGPGIQRKKMKVFVDILSTFRIWTGSVINGTVRGEVDYPNGIEKLARQDDNVHSYHRWGMDKRYFQTLNDTKILIYPGIDHWPFWDSKRPWEALASGCFVMFNEPPIDISEYSLADVCNYAQYSSWYDLIKKVRHLLNNPQELENKRQSQVEGAKKYFTPEPLSKYFLYRINRSIRR